MPLPRREGRATWCFSCGGIGATPDDHTRQSAALALGVPLALHPQARDLILERMRDLAAERGEPYEPDRDDNQHRLNMATFPQGAEIIPNPYNKIAGFSVRAGEGGVYFVPGFPVMAWPMIAGGWPHFATAPRAGKGERCDRHGRMDAKLTPLMERSRRVCGIKCSAAEVDTRGGSPLEIG